MHCVVLPSVLAIGLVLAGCSSDLVVSRAFVVQNRYEPLGCSQLKTERETLTKKIAELEPRYAKAGTGLGAAVYGPELVETRSLLVEAERAEVQKGCRETPRTEMPAGLY